MAAPITWLTIPKAGKIRIYTSGCPKNQKRCWYKIGSPPPRGKKNAALKFLSASSIVIPPASTGNDNSSSIVVIKIDHENKGIRSIRIPRAFIFQIVEIKLIDPANDDAPARCKLKMAKSTEGDGCASIPDNGGYTVQPVPAPFPAKAEITSK